MTTTSSDACAEKHIHVLTSRQRAVALRVCIALVMGAYLSPSQAQTGVEAARLLNSRFNSTPAQCVGRTPVFACSGVALRGVVNNPNQSFWVPAPVDSAALGFAFLRKDHAAPLAQAASGYVLFDRLSAVSLGKPYKASMSTDTVLVSDWNAQLPAQLPIQGLFYSTHEAASLLQAQHNQRDYYQATGTWLPILRLQPDDPEGKVFGFAQEDQLVEGYRVAKRLNERYQDTTMRCRGNSTPFDCNGVLVRTVDVGPFDFWNPSPQSVAIQYVSFSYLRRDASVNIVVSPQGYATRELAAPAVYPFVLGCSYPVDAGTHGAQTGNKNACTFSGVCSQLGITSVAAWSTRYKGVSWSSCSVGTDATALTFMNDIRRQVPGVVGWNEMMVQVWPQNIGRALAIQAVFYSTTTFYSGNGRPGSRTLQRQYFDKTQKLVPLLKLDLHAADGQVFSYEPDDQSL